MFITIAKPYSLRFKNVGAFLKENGSPLRSQCSESFPHIWCYPNDAPLQNYSKLAFAKLTIIVPWSSIWLKLVTKSHFEVVSSLPPSLPSYIFNVNVQQLLGANVYWRLHLYLSAISVLCYFHSHFSLRSNTRRPTYSISNPMPTEPVVEYPSVLTPIVAIRSIPILWHIISLPYNTHLPWFPTASRETSIVPAYESETEPPLGMSTFTSMLWAEGFS